MTLVSALNSNLFWQRLWIFSRNLLYRHIFGRIKVISNKFVIKLMVTYSDFLPLAPLTLLSSDSECQVSFALQSPSRSYQPNPTPTRVCAFEIDFHSPISQAPMILLQLEIFWIFLGIVQSQHLPVLTNDGVCTHPLSIQPTCPVRHQLRANLLPGGHSFGRQVACSLRFFCSCIHYVHTQKMVLK